LKISNLQKVEVEWRYGRTPYRAVNSLVTVKKRIFGPKSTGANPQIDLIAILQSAESGILETFFWRQLPNANNAVCHPALRHREGEMFCLLHDIE
jgi:hypothetical protein